MKFFSSFIFLISLSHASVIGFTEGCSEKAELFANEGENFVRVKLHGKEIRLVSTSGVFSQNAKNPVTFKSNDKNNKLGDPSLTFEMTSMVMSSLPRLIITYSGVQNKCMVNLYGPNEPKSH